MPMSGSCAAYPRQRQIGYLPALLQKEILLNTTKADIGHIETMTNEVKKSTDGSILFCAAITHLCSAKENIIAFKLSTDFSIYGVLGAMPLTSGQFDGKLPCLQGQRTRCPLPVERKMTPSFFTFNYLHSNLRHDLSCYFCLTVIYLSYQLSLIYIYLLGV